MGAVASGGLRYINRSVIEALDIDSQTIDAVSAREQAEIERRERVYRGGRLPLDVQGKTALLVDDGLATGSTMRAAIDALRQRDAARIVVVIPAAAAEACREISRVADETICAATPRFFSAVSEWYQEFSQITDEEVRQLLAKASSRALAPP
jgi:predicted phosphoribosyltransferase